MYCIQFHICVNPFLRQNKSTFMSWDMYFQIQIFTKRVYTGSFRESALLPFSTNTERSDYEQVLYKMKN